MDELKNNQFTEKCITAIRKNNVEAVKNLVQDCPSLINASIFKLSAETGSFELVEYFLSFSHIRSDSIAINWAAVRAIIHGHFHVLKILSDIPGFEPTFRDNQMLASVIDHNRLDILKFLLEEKGIDLTANNNAAIKIANQKNYMEMKKYLLSFLRTEGQASALEKKEKNPNSNTPRNNLGAFYISTRPVFTDPEKRSQSNEYNQKENSFNCRK